MGWFLLGHHKDCVRILITAMRVAGFRRSDFCEELFGASAGKTDWKNEADYESFFNFDLGQYPLCVSLGGDRFFLWLQLIDMDRFISEGAFDGADQLKTNQISAFCAPWKILAFADGE